MKRDILTIILLLSISSMVFFLANCGEDDEEPNKPPTVNITSPSNNADIEKGETVQITVTASDNDGSISNVKIFIDNVEEDSFNSPPYSVSVSTADAEVGQHTLKAVATDNGGLTATDQITVNITESAPPTVTTENITEIAETTATGGGNVTDDGGNDVSVRGVVWSDASGPTLESNSGKTEDGTGTGAFTSNLTGLTAATTYYVKAYATNNQGTSYGEEKSFTTEGSIATVVTGTISDITHESAVCSGEVTDEGGSTVTARGLVWTLTSNVEPTIETNLGMTTEGNGLGAFSSPITSLEPVKNYWVRAYATNSSGTAYGESKSFGTLEGPPSVTTADVTNIDAHVAIGGGLVTDFGGATLLDGVGIIWGKTANLDLADINSYDGFYQLFNMNQNGDHSFEGPLSGLDPETLYYVRAFAGNDFGTSYGEAKTFTTGSFSVVSGSFTDARDGNTYNTITISGQTWMAENLAYLPDVVCPSNEDCGYWVYDYQGSVVADAIATANYGTYGVLYSYNTASQACPTGWHLPSSAEWTIFEMNLGMPLNSAQYTGGLNTRGTDEGGKIKETGTSNWVAPNTGATNISGFSALPGGERSVLETFQLLGIWAEFWTSTQYSGTTDAHRRYVDSGTSTIHAGAYWEIHGLSVRCVED